MTVTAAERGRNLILTVGDDEDAIDITIKPLPAVVGAQLFALHVGITFGQSEQPEVDAENMSKLSLGEENWATVEELRWSEMELVLHAAFFWNVQAGGIDLVNELLQGSGYPKAQMTLLQRNGLSELYEQLTTLLNSGAAVETLSLAGTNGTSTPSSSDALSKLPANKRSIRQNQTP